MYVNVADAWKQISEAIGIGFEESYPEEVTYNRLSDAVIHYRNLDYNVESFDYQDAHVHEEIYY